MKITEVRIKLMENSEDRLRAFCSITFDNAFVVRDLKIIDGHSGPFVAMPSRKLSVHCQKCRSKNHMRSRYCNHCGAKIPRNVSTDENGRAKLYADIAHPINPECREMIQSHVLEEYDREIERSKQPGYVSNYDDAYESSEKRTLRIDPAVESTGTNPTVPPAHQKPSQQPDDATSAERDVDFGNGIFE